MKIKKRKNFLKVSLIFSLTILTNCVSSNNVTNPVTTATPSVTESSASSALVDPGTNPMVSPSSGSVPTPTPTATQSSGGQTNTGTSNSLTLQNGFLRVSYVDYYSTDLTWNAVNGAKSYRIYQDGKIIADNVTGLDYSVKNLTPNTDYTFEISAVNDSGESNKVILKVRTFIPGNSSSSNNSGNSNQVSNGTVTTPTPTANVQFNGGFN